MEETARDRSRKTQTMNTTHSQQRLNCKFALASDWKNKMENNFETIAKITRQNMLKTAA